MEKSADDNLRAERIRCLENFNGRAEIFSAINFLLREGIINTTHMHVIILT